MGSRDSSEGKYESGFTEKDRTVSSAKCDRGLYRICPSKLTKRELEDLYFNLLDTNLELSNSLKEKEEKIKGLTTKMHRLYSAKKVHEAELRKDCCITTKNILHQNKGSLSDLRRANERMAEKIRLLNIKLAAVTRQAVKAPQSSNTKDLGILKVTPKCSRCATESRSTKTSATQTRSTTNVGGRVCDENKCKTLMEEFKEKIGNLEAELAATHNEYSMRITRLELEMQQCRYEYRYNDTVAKVDKQRHENEDFNDLDNAADLKTLLTIEATKVANLEAQLNATEILDVIIIKSLEHHLTNYKEKIPGDGNNIEFDRIGANCKCGIKLSLNNVDSTEHMSMAIDKKRGMSSNNGKDSECYDENKIVNDTSYLTASNMHNYSKKPTEVNVPIDELDDSGLKDVSEYLSKSVDEKHTKAHEKKSCESAIDENNSIKVTVGTRFKNVNDTPNTNICEDVSLDYKRKDTPDIRIKGSLHSIDDYKHEDSPVYSKHLGTFDDTNCKYDLHANRLNVAHGTTSETDKNRHASLLKENISASTSINNATDTDANKHILDCSKPKNSLGFIRPRHSRDIDKYKEVHYIKWREITVIKKCYKDAHDNISHKYAHNLASSNCYDAVDSNKRIDDIHTNKQGYKSEHHQDKRRSNTSDSTVRKEVFNDHRRDDIPDRREDMKICINALDHVDEVMNMDGHEFDSKKHKKDTYKINNNEETFECYDYNPGNGINTDSRNVIHDDVTLTDKSQRHNKMPYDSPYNGGCRTTTETEHDNMLGVIDRQINSAENKSKVSHDQQSKSTDKNNKDLHDQQSKSKENVKKDLNDQLCKSVKNKNKDLHDRQSKSTDNKNIDLHDRQSKYKEDVNKDLNDQQSKSVENKNKDLRDRQSKPTDNKNIDLHDQQSESKEDVNKDFNDQRSKSVENKNKDLHDRQGKPTDNKNIDLHDQQSKSKEDVNKDLNGQQSESVENKNKDSHDRQCKFVKNRNKNLRYPQTKHETYENIDLNNGQSKSEKNNMEDLHDQLNRFKENKNNNLHDRQSKTEENKVNNLHHHNRSEEIADVTNRTGISNKITDQNVIKQEILDEKKKQIPHHTENFEGLLKVVEGNSPRLSNVSNNFLSEFDSCRYRKTSKDYQSTCNDYAHNIRTLRGSMDLRDPSKINDDLPDGNKQLGESTDEIKGYPDAFTNYNTPDQNHSKPPPDASKHQTIADEHESGGKRVSIPDTEGIQDQPITLPDTILDPAILVMSLSNINEDQMTTVVELERQLEAKKVSQQLGDDMANINEQTKFTKNFTTAEDDNIGASTSKATKDLPQNIKERTEKSKEADKKIKIDEPKPATAKHDQHNSLQIPGPIPVSTIPPKSKYKIKVYTRADQERKRTSKEMSRKPKDAFIGISQANNKEKDHKETTTKEKVLESRKNKNVPVNAQTVKADDVECVLKETDYSQGADIGTNLVPPNLAIKSSIMVHNNSSSSPSECVEPVATVEKETQVNPNLQTVATRKLSKEDGELPVSISRDVTTYRNQSGILCFKTIPTTERVICCPCMKQSICERQRNIGIQAEQTTIAAKNEQGTFTDQRTEVHPLSVPENAQPKSTPPVPEEIKTPVEHETQKVEVTEQGTDMNESPALLQADRTRRLSVRDEEESPKTPTSSRNSSIASYTQTDQDYHPAMSTLYERRMPPPMDVGTAQCVGTDNVTPKNNDDKAIHDDRTTSNGPSLEKVGETLHALTGELARCKELLLRQRSREERSLLKEHQHSADLSVLDDHPAHELRPGQANHTIVEQNALMCVFTLHIGTIVLSDEAVLNTHDKSLVLRWKFYDQNVSMTRMNACRVMLFDFSTEYDIKVTDEFLDYMKHEEMEIVICELNYQDKAFATCALPLRHALLHTNRRADMSLALVAGPRMIAARNANKSSDPLDAGDEMGVIDMWCMLRADNPKLVPIINRAIARSSPQKKRFTGNSLNMRSHSESDEGDLSTVQRAKKTQSNCQQTYQNIRDQHLNTWKNDLIRQDEEDPAAVNSQNDACYHSKSLLPLPRTVPVDEGVSYSRKESHVESQSMLQESHMQPKIKDELLQSKDGPSKYPKNCRNSAVGRNWEPLQEVSRVKPIEEAKETQSRTSDDTRTHEGLFVNEVIANIKTPEDVKHAMQHTNRNSLYAVSRLPKPNEDIISQAQTSLMSYINKRETRDKKRSTRASSKPPRQHTDSRESEEPYLPPLMLPDEPSEKSSVHARYENISKLYGSKLDITKRHITINSNERQIEEPQKDEPIQNNVTQDQNAEFGNGQLEIAVLWLALNEECEAMLNPHIQRVYVAYSFLGRSGADLETPFSLPKPKHHVDKCYFNFKKSFRLMAEDLPLLGHMVRCRTHSRCSKDAKDCIIFTVVSEPPEDPLGLETCEDIGYAYLYLGDLLAYSAGSPIYTEVIPVTACGGSSICGVLAIRVDGLDVLRQCFDMTATDHVPVIRDF